MDYCLYEISGNDAIDANPVVPAPFGDIREEADELSPLLPNPVGVGLGLRSASRRAEMKHVIPRLTLSSATVMEDPRTGGHTRTGVLKDLNALEIAVIANAKRFLSQYIVQKIITGLWHGEIVFWDEVSANATKKPRYYNARTADPYSRLRVPKYLKAWEVAFFIAFLILYYSVVLERSHTKIPVVEMVFYVWLLAFAWDEVLEWGDSGIFYLADFWNVFDMIMISIGFVFAILRKISLVVSSCSSLTRQASLAYPWAVPISAIRPSTFCPSKLFLLSPGSAPSLASVLIGALSSHALKRWGRTSSSS